MSTEVERHVTAFLYVPDEPGEGGLTLRIPDDALLTEAQREQVTEFVLSKHGDIFDQFDVMGYGAGAPPPDDELYRVIEVRAPILDCAFSPGSRAWDAEAVCLECSGTCRQGFGGRLECPSCHRGATRFRLDVAAASASIVVARKEESSPLAWLIRASAREPLPLSIGKWFGWLRHEDECLLVSAESWPAFEEALDNAERVADELERLQAEAD